MKIDQKNIENILALTPMQEGMLFHYLKDPENHYYFEQLSLQVSGSVDIHCLEQAWNLVIETNEMLRTVFRWQKLKEPTQIILKAHRVTLRYYERDGRDTHQWIEEIKARDRNETFDLQQVPFRVTLGKIDTQRYIMIISHHHILYDGWSTGIVLTEFLAAYRDLVNKKYPVKPLKTKLEEFIRWKQNREKEIAVKKEKFWNTHLAGFEPPTKLSIKRTTAAASQETVCYQVRIARHLKGKIDRYIKKYKITMAALLYSAWGILLQKYNNTNDVMFGFTVSGRNARIKGIENMVGLFINTLPLRIHTPTTEKTAEFLLRVNQILQEQDEYEHTALTDIKEYSGIDGNEDMFDTLVVVENYPLDTRLHVENRPLSIDSYSMVEHTHYDLTVGITPTPTEILINFSFPKELFDEALIEQLSHHYPTVMENLINNPEQRAADIEILSPAEKKQLLVDFNRTQADYPKEKTLQQLFEEQVDRTPDRTALIGQIPKGVAPPAYKKGTRGLAPLFVLMSITYKELNQKSRQLAYLLKEKGVKPDTIVGIMVERSLEMIIGVLGILKAGGAYLPIDANYPQERIDYMLKDSGAKILLTGQEITDLYSPPAFKIRPEGTSNHPCQASSLAYIIYTSGTTGNPKGVLVEHENVVRLLFNDQFPFDFNEQDVWTLFHSYCFDFSVWEMYGALLYGGKLIIIPRKVTRDPHRYLEILKKQGVTVLNQVPSVFYHLMAEEMKTGEKKLRLRYIIFGGEALNPGKLQEWKKKYPGTRLVNMYGITETTVHVTYKEITPKEIEAGRSNIGKPIPTLTAYVMDKHLKLLPMGVPGEIFVGGKGLSRGYLNRPLLTANKFILNPYNLYRSHMSHTSYISHMSYIYRTGDLARWVNGVGDMEYLGRIDHQVNIRGFRIEIGEIESRLIKHEKIKEAVVNLKEDKSGDKYLCAYIVPRKPGNFEIPQLRNYLSAKLPDYMVPAFFVELPQIPLTSTGKVDRKALPHPAVTSSMVYTAPQDPAEEIMVETWSDILQIEKENISTNSNFFELGGHSLKATRLITRIHKAFDVEISIADIFAYPTPGELCSQIRNKEKQAHQSIGLTEEKEYYPLTSAQDRFYVFQQLEPGNTSYNMPEIMLLQGKVSREKFEKVFKKLIQRHESLRTSFFLVKGEAVQRVHPAHQVPFTLEFHQSGSRQTGNFSRPFDLSRLPLLRLGLLETEKEKYFLMFDMHHIISDGVSIGIFIKEFLAYYQGEEPAPLRLRYKDYVTWLNQRKKQTTKNQTIKTPGSDPEQGALNLPSDYQRPIKPNFEGNTIKFEIPTREKEALKLLSLKENTTLYMILLSIFNVLLAKLSGQENIIVGSPMAGRQHHDLQGLLGLFINTLVLQNFPAGEKPFTAFLKEVKANALQAFENQDYQYEELVEKITLARASGRNPLFDVMFVLQNMERQEIEIPGLKATRDVGQRRTSKFDMTLYGEEEDNLVFRLEYSTSLFKKETMRRFTRYFRNIITNVLQDPAAKISSIEMMPEDEKMKLLFDFNNRGADYPRDNTIHQLFQSRVDQVPGNIAIAGGSSIQPLTYRQLNEKANRLAGVLRQRGLGPDNIAALLVERSTQMIIGILAVLKAGGAYLPIDPANPRERIEYILQDSRANLLLITKQSAEKTGNFKETIDLEEEISAAVPGDNPGPHCSPSHLAYIIYTSGTTGKPKGVMIQHGNVVRLMFNNKNLFDFTAEDTWTMFHSYCFDFSVWEMYGALLYGGTLVMVPKMTAKNPAKFREILKEHEVTVLNQTPSAFYPLVEEELKHPAKELKVRYVIFGGEALSPLQLKGWQEKYPQTKLINMYGITETTVHVTYKEITAAEIETNTSNIGKPIPTLSTFTTDKYLKPQPIGVIGELCVGGEGLGRGYLNRPELTAAVFVENPFQPGERLYRSGDLVRISTNREMEYMGRKDQQVKIRGFRIELGEITNHLLNHPGIKEAIITAKADKTGDHFLCGYIVPHPVDSFENLQLRAYLQEKIPDYMIPAYFVEVAEMPLTSTGKIDRKSLPDPGITSAVEYVAPRDAVEDSLVNIWSEILGLDREQIGIHDNFFHLGGHSLKAAGLLAGIHRQFSLEIPLAEIFKTPTIEGIAGYINQSGKGAYLPIEPAAKKDYYPLSSAQKRLYILQQIDPQSTTYNMPAIMILAGKLHRTHIENTFRELINRHESLRTSFDAVDDQPAQRIQDKAEFEIEYYQVEVKVEKIISNFIRPFDLSRAPLLRVGLIKTKKQEHILMTDMHHIISDALSKEILIKELVSLYLGEKLPALRLQYKDFSQWQNQRIISGRVKKQQEYWLHEFNGNLPIIQIPTDYKRPVKRSFTGNRETFNIPAQQAGKLRKLAEEEHATMFMVLLTIYNTLLAKLGQQEDIIVGTMIAGRRHPDLENIIGVFVNTLALRNYPRGDQSFIEFFREVRKRTLDAFDNQDYQFEDLVEKLNIERDASRNPLFDVVFSFRARDANRTREPHPGPEAKAKEPHLEVKAYEPGEEKRLEVKFDILLTGVDTGEELFLVLEYSTELFKKETIQRFIKYYKEIVSAVLANESIPLKNINISHDLVIATSKIYQTNESNFDF
ncbi:MAG: amino acid adenylation domain-containing protein [Candidatus Aminicenantes bacterium]|nr:MAG: amino acid adenylation domain-containing protein [Candidatus Aminicenantes bacterium]